MKWLVSVAVLLLTFASAHAEDKAKDSPHVLTYSEAITIGNVLKQLNTYTVMSKDNTPISVPYRFSVTTLGAILNDIRQADVALKTYNELYQAIGIKIYGSQAAIDKLVVAMKADPKMVDPNAAEFAKQVTEAQNAPAGVLMTKIKESELQLSVNPITPAYLYALDPIIERTAQ
jgi:hypothetical protein